MWDERKPKYENTIQQLNTFLYLVKMLLTILLEEVPNKSEKLNMMKKVYSVYVKRMTKTTNQLSSAKGFWNRRDKSIAHLNLSRFDVAEMTKSIQLFKNYDPESRTALGLALAAPRSFHDTLSKRCQLLVKAEHFPSIRKQTQKGKDHQENHPTDLIRSLYLSTTMLKPLGLTVNIVGTLIHVITDTQMLERFVQLTLPTTYGWPTTRMQLQRQICIFHHEAYTGRRNSKRQPWGLTLIDEINALDDLHNVWCASWEDQFTRQVIGREPNITNEQVIHETIREGIVHTQEFLKQRRKQKNKRPRPIRPETLLRHLPAMV